MWSTPSRRRGWVCSRAGASWPATMATIGAVRVQYVAAPEPLPDDASQAIRLIVGPGMSTASTAPRRRSSRSRPARSVVARSCTADAIRLIRRRTSMSTSDVAENAILNLILRATAWANVADNAAGTPLTSIARRVRDGRPGRCRHHVDERGRPTPTTPGRTSRARPAWVRPPAGSRRSRQTSTSRSAPAARAR